MRIIDLSQTIVEGMDTYPGDPEVKIDLLHSHEENNWELRQLTLGSHTGTHVDSFSHMHAGKKSIDEIPLERFFGKAQLVHLSEDWPKNQGLFFSEEIGISQFHQLVQANPNFVGGEITEELERALLGVNVITYTDLVNLEDLPYNQSFTFYGLPLKIKNGDGSPVRAMAILDEG